MTSVIWGYSGYLSLHLLEDTGHATLSWFMTLFVTVAKHTFWKQIVDVKQPTREKVFISGLTVPTA